MGTATTYGRLATALGDVRAAKWVATELLRPHDAAGCCCHRVVRANGEPGRYAHGDAAAKLDALRHDGVDTRNGRVLAMVDVPTADCLASLREWQRELTRLPEPPASGQSAHVAGLDVSYAAGHAAVAACVSFGADDREIRCDVGKRIGIRELPALVAAFDAYVADYGRPNVLLVDGAGSLHPRRTGIAVAVSRVLGVPAIGVAKSHLCGTVGEERDGVADVSLDGKRAGVRLRWRSPRMKRDQFLYTSPGGGITLDDAVRDVRDTLEKDRLPMPIAAADRISRREAKLRSVKLLKDHQVS